MGLVQIVLATFALLNELDMVLFRFKPSLLASPLPFFSEIFSANSFFSLVTALSWAAIFITTPAPLPVRGAAVSFIAIGYKLRGGGLWLACMWAESVIWAANVCFGDGKAVRMIVLHAVLNLIFYATSPYPRYKNTLKKKNNIITTWCDTSQVPITRNPPFATVLLFRVCLQILLMRECVYSCLGHYAIAINVLLMCLQAYGSVRPFEKTGWHINCYWSGYLAWIIALLTGQPWLYFYGSAFAASLLQGCAHEWTGEAANLPELALRTDETKGTDQHAHTSFFPLLILHVAYDMLTGQKRGKGGRKRDPGMILVTGCAGRIGRAVCQHLVGVGLRVRGYDRQTRPKSLLPGTPNGSFEYVQGDLADTKCLRAAVSGCESVCHFAAVPDDADVKTALVPVNILGLDALLEACRGGGVTRLILASSGKIFYHRNSGFPIRVDDPPRPTCMYDN